MYPGYANLIYMSIPKSQANTESTAAHDTIVAAANAKFIAAADVQIDEAIDRGVFWVNCQTFDLEVDPKTVFMHYADLGYKVELPDYPTNRMLQPAELFGEFWVNYWTNSLIPRDIKKPFRMIIRWE